MTCLASLAAPPRSILPVRHARLPNCSQQGQQPARPVSCRCARQAPADDKQAPSASRREHLLGLAGAAAWRLLSSGGAAQARSSGLDLPACSNLQRAGSLSYCDVRQGAGDSPQKGDQIAVNYTARVADTGRIYDGSKYFNFVLGNDEVVPGWEAAILGTKEMPPIKEGGLRTVRIPSDQAFGSRGEGCLFGRSENCRVPPDADIEITFEYLGLGY